MADTKTVLDIIDTAVKIGLGAIISGVATYIVSHQKHRSELKSEVRERKTQLLKECSLKYMQSITLNNQASRSIRLERIQGNKNQEKLFEFIHEIEISYNLAKEASSIASLIGEAGLAKNIDMYAKIIEEKEFHYEEKRFEYDIELSLIHI